MSENSSRKPLENVLSVDSTNIESTNGNPLVNGQERKSLVTSNTVRNGTLPSFSSNDISNAIAKQAQALQQAAALLQQHNNDQPMVMAKKSNVLQPSSKNNTQMTSGMVQLNVVNENGIVTPIEVNASVAAAAAFVAAQKHQNQRLEASASGNLNPIANGITNVGTSLGSSPKQNDLGSKITKSLPSSNIASLSNVSNVLIH